jgi:uncharacterized protein
MPTLDSARALYAGGDAVHDFSHIERVYRLAVNIAHIEGAELEIVKAAALLHDLQAPQAKGSRTAHQHSSAELAEDILAAEGWPSEQIAAVQHCIRSHRFRDLSEPPATLEAKVLFDADKLDAIGAVGVARAIAYAVQAGQPVYARPSARFYGTGQLETGEPHSAYHEFVFKLVNIQQRIYTPAGRNLAEQRHQRMADYFEGLRMEMDGE